MKIEAVSVCVNYADFLRQVAPFNRVHFDRWVIVTSPDDADTREACRRLNLECLVTEDFNRGSAPFNKGAGIERGISLCAHDGWMLHIDADIVLPGDFREALESAHLDESCLYGCDRYMVQGWDAWQKIKSSGWASRGWHCTTSPHPGHPIGTRWTDVRFGYVPIGFFQLWNPAADHYRGIRTRRYPDRHQDAARADVQFGLQWDRRKRVLLPEVIAAHLESEPAKLGANWKGRKTIPFGPRPLPPIGPKSPS